MLWRIERVFTIPNKVVSPDDVCSAAAKQRFAPLASIVRSGNVTVVPLLVVDDIPDNQLCYVAVRDTTRS